MNSKGGVNTDGLVKIDNGDIQEVISQYEKKIYDLQQLLEISRSLCSTLDFSNLIESILYTCMGQFRVLGAGIFVLNALDTDSYQLNENYSGIDIDPNVVYEIPSANPLVKFLESCAVPLTMEELTEKVTKACDISVLAAMHPSLIVPLIQHKRLNGVLVLGEKITLDEEKYSDDEKDQAAGIASLAAIAINNAALLERSSTDMMTHLKLKYFFFNVLTERLDAAFANDRNLSVIMFDIDFFKRFNDTYGHACGDYVLQTVAKVIKSSIRAQDLASRYGGEEFTVLLADTRREDAMTVADRIRSKIEQYDFNYENQHVKVTISVGVSTFDIVENPAVQPRVLVDQADQALYVSKRSGRNRVTFADPKLISEIRVEE